MSMLMESQTGLPPGSEEGDIVGRGVRDAGYWRGIEDEVLD